MSSDISFGRSSSIGWPSARASRQELAHIVRRASRYVGIARTSCHHVRLRHHLALCPSSPQGTCPEANVWNCCYCQDRYYDSLNEGGIGNFGEASPRAAVLELIPHAPATSEPAPEPEPRQPARPPTPPPVPDLVAQVGTTSTHLRGAAACLWFTLLEPTVLHISCTGGTAMRLLTRRPQAAPQASHAVPRLWLLGCGSPAVAPGSRGTCAKSGCHAA